MLQFCCCTGKFGFTWHMWKTKYKETSVYATIACHLTRCCIFNNQARLSNYMLI